MRRCAWLPLLGLALGCDALVGGECADGYVPDGSLCVPRSAALAPAGPGGGSQGEGASPGTHGVGGASTGAGAFGGGAGTPSGGAGTGGDVGSGTTSTGGGQCLVPLTACGGSCVDLDQDPNHCGACSQVCATGLCDNGTCQGGTPGHVVVVGMSFEQTTPASRHLLGNAVFLPLHEPLRVLELQGAAEPDALAQVQTILTAQGQARGRAVQTEIVDDASAASAHLVADPFDVLLIHDQVGASPSVMATAAADLAPGLTAHAARRGTVVVLAASPSMADFLRASDLLDVVSLTPVTGDTLTNAQPSSALGIHVPSPFLASASSSSLELSTNDPAQIIVTHVGDDLPVAVHKTVP